MEKRHFFSNKVELIKNFQNSKQREVASRYDKKNSEEIFGRILLYELKSWLSWLTSRPLYQVENYLQIVIHITNRS